MTFALWIRGLHFWEGFWSILVFDFWLFIARAPVPGSVLLMSNTYPIVLVDLIDQILLTL